LSTKRIESILSFDDDLVKFTEICWRLGCSLIFNGQSYSFFSKLSLSGNITNNQLTERRSQICYQVPLSHNNNNGCRCSLLSLLVLSLRVVNDCWLRWLWSNIKDFFDRHFLEFVKLRKCDWSWKHVFLSHNYSVWFALFPFKKKHDYQWDMSQLGLDVYFLKRLLSYWWWWPYTERNFVSIKICQFSVQYCLLFYFTWVSMS
jgi:hypothetical protein